MRVVHHSGTRLVLSETPAVAWLIGALLLGGALVFVALTAVTAWALAFAIAMALLGRTVYRLAGIRAIVDFDGQRGSLSIARRRLGKLPEVERQGAIADVELEVSEHAEGSPSCRLVFKMADGGLVAPVPTSPHDLDHHLRAAGAVRKFLGLTGDVPRRPPDPSP